MITIEHIQTPEIRELLKEFSDSGGVIEFKVLRIAGAASTQQAHAAAANETLRLIIQDNDEYFNQLAASTNTSRDLYRRIGAGLIAEEAGIALSPEQFFGPYFNYPEKRPILLGQKGEVQGNYTYYSDYYHFDDAECPENIVHIQRNESDQFATLGYADAFFKPVHSFGRKGMSNYEIGQFFLTFNRQFLGDLSSLSVFSWPTDCSNFFDDGKEWWGSFFWTVYNAEKGWYVGIAASATD